MKIDVSKEFLYREVARFKEHLGYRPDDHNIDIFSLFGDHERIVIEEVNYSSNSLRGVASFGSGGDRDIILLNKKRKEIEKKFDCCHEALHLWLHREVDVEIFNCFEGPFQNCNHFYEWQATEGTEEFFIPYKAILPIIRERRDQLNSWDSIQALKRELSGIFNTPDYTIDYRLESIRYEIQQYLDGTPLDEVQLISVWEQNKRNIPVRSIKDMEMELLKSRLQN